MASSAGAGGLASPNRDAIAGSRTRHKTAGAGEPSRGRGRAQQMPVAMALPGQASGRARQRWLRPRR